MAKFWTFERMHGKQHKITQPRANFQSSVPPERVDTKTNDRFSDSSWRDLSIAAFSGLTFLLLWSATFGNISRGGVILCHVRSLCLRGSKVTNQAEASALLVSPIHSGLVSTESTIIANKRLEQTEILHGKRRSKVSWRFPSNHRCARRKVEAETKSSVKHGGRIAVRAPVRPPGTSECDSRRPFLLLTRLTRQAHPSGACRAARPLAW